MKRIVLFLAAATCVLAGCSRNQKFTVSGDLAAAGLPESITSFQIVSTGLDKPIDVEVKDKAFSVRGEIKKPAFAKLVSSSPDQKVYPALILEKGDITFSDFRPVGTPSNDADKAFTDQLTEIRKQHTGNREETMKAAEEAFFAFVAQHKNDPCAVFAIMLADRRLLPETVLKLIESAGPDVRNEGEVRQLSKKMQGMVKK